MDSLASSRRQFIVKASALAAGMAGGPVLATEHGTHGAMLGHGGEQGYVMRADVTQHCATCEFWGGQRRLNAERTEVTVGGLGWCNNPQSPNFQKLTSPEHGPMQVWKKWGALG
ncbi:MAG: twin-arginine translocation signal domain-containing protein [Gammaproteobacteria bacterium]